MESCTGPDMFEVGLERRLQGRRKAARLQRDLHVRVRRSKHIQWERKGLPGLFRQWNKTRGWDSVKAVLETAREPGTEMRRCGGGCCIADQ